MEALGLPCYARKMLPTANIHFTYDKGGEDVHRFSLGKESFNKINQLDNQYDVIISRSSALKSMMSREHDSQVVKNSSLRVNIKTMSLQ